MLAPDKASRAEPCLVRLPLPVTSPAKLPAALWVKVSVPLPRAMVVPEAPERLPMLWLVPFRSRTPEPVRLTAPRLGRLAPASRRSRPASTVVPPA